MSGVAVATAALLICAHASAGANPGLRLAEVAVIGAGTQEPLFGSVRRIAFGAPGQLLVLDGRSAEVTVTDLVSGKLLVRVGGPGPGPGEFLGPTLLGASRGGSFSVLDRDAGARISRFSGDGAFLGLTDVSGEIPNLTREIAVTEAGTYVLGVPSSTELRRSGGARRALLVFLENTARGKVDVAPDVVFDWADLGVPPMQLRDPNGPIAFHVEPQPVWSLLPDGGHAIGRSDRYEVVVLGPDGAKVGTLRRTVERRRFTTEHKERIFAAMPPGLLDLGAEFGEFLPVIADVYPGPDGTILVQRSSDNGPVVDVFSAHFELVDEVPLPEGFRLVAARDGLLAGRITTADFETAVKVLRLER